MPRAIQELIISAIRRQSLHDYSGWVDELAEVIVRGSFLENGYFRVDVSANAELLSQTASLEHFALIVWVDPGPQYRLGRMQFRSADPDRQLVFPTEELRALVPLRDGDIFNVMKLRQAFDSLRRLYATSGWIDFTPNPKFDIDDAAKRIDLTLQLDQEKQYRVGNIDIWGENPAAERIVRSTFKSGEIFDGYLVDRFYAENTIDSASRGFAPVRCRSKEGPKERRCQPPI